MDKTSLIEQAEAFSKQKHVGQKLVTGKPYFEHPKEVARILKEWNLDKEVIISGYLHDCVEDCEVSLEEITKLFGGRVAYLVDGMSWIRGSDKTKDFDKTYKKFALYSKQEPVLILIKLADMLANLPNISEPSHREWVVNKSYPRNMAFYIPLMRAVGLSKQVGSVVNEFHKYTQKPVQSVLYDYLSKEELSEIKVKIKELKP